MVTPRQPEDHRPEDRLFEGWDLPYRDAGRQPASPDDLAAFPPEGETCANIRTMLRDFVDGDVTAVDQATVESHAHECRTCALALSRAESEKMQVVASFAEIDVSEIGSSSGFTASVMQQVREIAVSQPSVGFTTRVMARVRETAFTESVLDLENTSVGYRRVPLFVLLAATVLFGTWIGLRIFEPATPTAVEVLSAERAEMVRDGDRTSLVATDHWNAEEHRAADEFVTHREGALALRWKSNGEAVELQADEFTRFRLGSGDGPVEYGRVAGVDSVVDLLDGALSVRTETDVTVSFGDGSSVSVGRGDYHVTVQSVRHQDARPGLLVKVHVRDGAARIDRGGRYTAVAKGSQALYTTFTPVTIDRAPDDDLILLSRRRARDRVAPLPEVAVCEERFFGQVLDPRTSTPVPNVSVWISTFRGDQTVTTNEDGMFRLTGRDEFRGQFVVIRAAPPPNIQELAPLQFAPIFLGQREGSEDVFVVHRFFLERASDMRGRVHESTRRPLAGLWLQPCRADELFGTVVPIGALVDGDEGGNFAIRGLSASAQAHQTMLLVAGGEGHRPRVVWARTAVKVEDSTLDIVLSRVEEQRVGGFEPGSFVHLLLAIDGVSAGSAVWPAIMQADSSGRLSLDLSAPVFLLSAVRPPQLLRRSCPEMRSSGTSEFIKVPLPSSLRHLRIGSLTTDKVHWFRANKLPEVARLSTGGGFVSVHEESSGHVCPGASVFLRGADGSVRFLGVFDGRVPLPCASGTAGELLVRTPEGWVGHLGLDGSLGRARKSMAVQKPGRVVWHGVPRSVVVMLRLAGSDLPQPIARQGDEREWQLQAGTYRFGERTLRLDSNATITLK